MRISDWSSDVCSSDLRDRGVRIAGGARWRCTRGRDGGRRGNEPDHWIAYRRLAVALRTPAAVDGGIAASVGPTLHPDVRAARGPIAWRARDLGCHSLVGAEIGRAHV